MGKATRNAIWPKKKALKKSENRKQTKYIVKKIEEEDRKLCMEINHNLSSNEQPFLKPP